jgi:geranylgeranylglycerol-phosphate geranylgeranyltransferase
VRLQRLRSTENPGSLQSKGLPLPLFSLIRPANSILVGFAVIVGVAVTSNSYREIFTATSMFGFLTGFFISSFSMVSNDIYDLEVDRLNQPGRPIPSGQVSVRQAQIFSAVLLTLGLLASAAIGVSTFLIAAIFALVGWYYNYGGKKTGLFGNSLVALSLAIPYIFGSVALGNYQVNLAYILALTSFLAGMGREILKGIADAKGDEIRGIRTVAVSFGTSTAKRLAAIFFLLAVITSTFPLVFGLLGNAFLIYSVLILIPDAIFVYLSAKVLTLKIDQHTLRLKSVALGGMMLGLIVYLISGLLV